MPKRRPKAIPSLKGGVFAHDPSASIAAVNVDGGVLSWPDVPARSTGSQTCSTSTNFPRAQSGPRHHPLASAVIRGITRRLARRNERCGIGAGRCFPKLQQKSDEALTVVERFHKIWSRALRSRDKYTLVEERFVEQALGILELLRFLLPLVIW